MDSAESAVLLGLARRTARLVVDHDQLARLVDIEPVDDPSQQHAVQIGFKHQLDADRPRAVGILEIEVAPDEIARIFEELRRLRLGKIERPVLFVGLHLLPRPIELGEGDISGACALVVVPEEQFECPVDKAPLDGCGRRRLRNPVDDRELECERAAAKGAHLARRERSGKRNRHRSQATTRVCDAGCYLGSPEMTQARPRGIP